MGESKQLPSAIRLLQRGEEPVCLLVDTPVTYLDMADAVNVFRRDPGSVIFGDVKRIDKDRFQELAVSHVEALGEVAGVYRVDLSGGVTSVLDPDRGWRLYDLDDVCRAALSAGSPTTVPRQERQERFDRALREEPFSILLPVTLTATRPLTEEDFIPEDSIEEMDDHLNFYLAINCDVDALFGTHFDQCDSWLNVYANYDLGSGEMDDYLEMTLCRYDDVDVPLRYHLTCNEQELLLAKVRDYCQQCGTPLEEWRREYLAEHSQTAAPSATMEQTM